MHFAGTVEINAPREQRLGVSSSTRTRSGRAGRASRAIEVIDDTHFKAKAKVGIGFISATFNVDMTIAEIAAAGPGGHQGPRPGAG